MHTRRDVLASMGAATAVAVTPQALAAWEASERYPDPSVQVLDPGFNKSNRLLLAGVERLATGMRWSEGPVYFGDARCVYWSDIPSDHALGRSDRARRRLPPTVQQRCFERHLDYIHINPVHHGLSRAACDWPHSSFLQWVERGAYDPRWGSDIVPELPQWAKQYE
jgi:hypothetical protein